MNTPRPPALAVGTRLADYRVEALLGSGSFAHTYRATDLNLGLQVAIKEFCPARLVERAADGALRLLDSGRAEHLRWCIERFLGEAQVLAHFKHPNIVRVSRYFCANGTGYIVLDYEEGRSLAQLLEQQAQRPDEEQLRRIFVPLLDGLAAVHRKRWLHRDIKPGNIFLRDGDWPVLIDFGAAEHAIARRDSSDTVLTPGYAPLEQYRSDLRESPATDLYALGATVFRCMTGLVPMDAEQRERATADGQRDPLREPLAALRGRYSPALLETVMRMLALRPGDRPRTADSVLETLGPDGAADGAEVVAGQPCLLVVGPTGAGKNAAVAALSEPGAAGAPGGLWLSADERVQVVAMAARPGEVEWQRLRRGAVGLLVLLDNTRPQPLRDLDQCLASFRDLVEEAGVAVGVTRTEEARRPSIADYHAHLHEHVDAGGAPLGPPVFTVDPRSRDDLMLLVQALCVARDPVAAVDAA